MDRDKPPLSIGLLEEHPEASLTDDGKPRKISRSLFVLQWTVVLLAMVGFLGACIAMGYYSTFPRPDRFDNCLFWGGFVSVVSCFVQIAMFSSVRAWRVHPGPLIFYRSISDLFFAGVFVYVSFTRECADKAFESRCCRWSSAVTQMAALSSEGWFFVMSLDLYLSLTNPFTSDKANLRRYHVYVWGSGLISALVLFSRDADGQLIDNPTQGFCWATQITNSPALGFGIFYSWILVYYFSAICITCFAWIRLQEGIESTLATRKHVLSTGRNYTMAFCAYWTVTILSYLLTGEDDDRRFSDFHPLFCFLLAARGFVNLCAWLGSIDCKHSLHEVSFSSEVDLDQSPGE
jgi:hypothetical protein